MTFLASLLALALTLSANAADSPELRAHRSKVLQHFIEFKLNLQVKALESCNDPRKSDFIEGVENHLANELASPEKNLLAALKLYARAKKLDSENICSQQFLLARFKQHSAERKKFRTIRKLGLGTIINDADPHCSLIGEKDFRGGLENNPCFAGDHLVFSLIWKSQADPFKPIDTFLTNLYHAIESAQHGSTLDYFEIYAGVDFEYFTGLMAFLSASATSESGYVDGFGEELVDWAVGKGFSAEQTAELYHAMRTRKDLYRDNLAWASAKQAHLSLFGVIDLDNANRHDFMAAFLGCRYEKLGDRESSEVIPNLLGLGYESLDFISHLKQGVSLRKSWKNFRQDTARYRRSSHWGALLCR